MRTTILHPVRDQESHGERILVLPRTGLLLSTPLKAVFLDAGGTLLHLDRPFILETLARHGIVRSEADLLAASELGRARIDELLRSEEPGNDTTRWRAYAAILLDELGCAGMVRERMRYAVSERLRTGRLWSYVLPGTVETLQALRDAGFRIGVVSNSDGRIDSYLERAGLRELIDVVVDSGRIGIEKPDPRIFQTACRLAGCEPHEVVHVGDLHEIDVVGARAAGIEPILLDPFGTQAAAECARIASLEELPALIGGRVAPVDAVTD